MNGSDVIFNKILERISDKDIFAAIELEMKQTERNRDAVKFLKLQQYRDTLLKAEQTATPPVEGSRMQIIRNYEQILERILVNQIDCTFSRQVIGPESSLYLIFSEGQEIGRIHFGLDPLTQTGTQRTTIRTAITRGVQKSWQDFEDLNHIPESEQEQDDRFMKIVRKMSSDLGFYVKAKKLLADRAQLAKPEKPDGKADLAVHFQWYHQCRDKGLKVTLKEVANNTGFSESHVKREHSNWCAENK